MENSRSNLLVRVFAFALAASLIAVSPEIMAKKPGDAGNKGNQGEKGNKGPKEPKEPKEPKGPKGPKGPKSEGLPDLSGGTFTLKVKDHGTTPTVNNATVTILNHGDGKSSNTQLAFFMSFDDQLDTDTLSTTAPDTMFKTVSLGSVKQHGSKKRTIGGGLFKDLITTPGQHIIAVIDPDNTQTELDETNNVIVSDPLPF